MNQPPGIPPPPPPPPGAPPPPGTPPPGATQADPPFSEPVDLRARSPQAAFRVPFSVLDAIAGIAAYFGGQLVIGIVLAVALILGGADATELDAGSMLLLAMVAQIAGIGLALVYLRARRRLSWRLLGPVRPGWLTVALGLALGLGATVAGYAVNMVLALLFDPQDPVEQQLIQDMLAGGRPTVLAIIIAVVLAPLFEELLFRGMLFQSLRRRVGMWPAALLSSAAFTIIHVEIIASQPLALAGLFALGVVFAWGFHRTGSLLVPIIAHAMFNGIALLLVVAIERFDLDELDTLTAVASVIA